MADTDDSKRVERTENYADEVQRQFSSTVNKLLKLFKSCPELEQGQMFSWDAMPKKIRQQAEELLKELNADVQLAIKKDIEVEWNKAAEVTEKIIKASTTKETATNLLAMSAIAEQNAKAMNQFIKRSDSGMNLSDRVWKACQQLRDEMEVAITVGIGEGESAASMSRRVRKYLNDPDLMFRRFRYKDENGEWQTKWKKKVIVNGKTKWTDYDKDSYKTGRGVYKSSARNAMRVARTETNMAYRNSNIERWRCEDFVIGFRIALSRSHPAKPENEICEKLAGDYPKDFTFEGWHPQCFCTMMPIFAPEGELNAWSKAQMTGEEYEFKTKPLTDYPSNFKDWVKQNEGRITAARKKGTEPYFLKHNKDIVDGFMNLGK